MFFEEVFGKIFLERFFWEKFIVRIFLGGTLCRVIFCFSRFLFLSRFCLNAQGQEI